MPAGLGYKLGVIDQKLETNDEQHKTIIASLQKISEDLVPIRDNVIKLQMHSAPRDKQHEEMMKTVRDVCATLEPLQISSAIHDTHIEGHRVRLVSVEGDVKKVKGIVDTITGKVVAFGTIASALVAGIIWLGKVFLSHLTTR